MASDEIAILTWVLIKYGVRERAVVS